MKAGNGADMFFIVINTLYNWRARDEGLLGKGFVRLHEICKDSTVVGAYPLLVPLGIDDLVVMQYGIDMW
jgi:hypothetical protein